AYLIGGDDFHFVSGPPGNAAFPNPSTIADGIVNAPGAANGIVTVNLPAIFEVQFDDLTTVDGFSLFSQVGTNGVDGVGSFSVSLFDGGGGLLHELTSASVNVGNNWQNWTFAEIEGVSSARFTILTGLAGSFGVEASEIRFSGYVVPEPTSAVLVGCAALMMGFRRGRR
ncbi:MAG TPA: PEP-CTERM sorting domain-containing protein, partial [Luteolibacter sp.]|nr:PEP-CTERM sorting domain-containing protein [Luteolibacter sp.]